MFIITSLGPATVQKHYHQLNFNSNLTTATAKSSNLSNSRGKSLSLAVTKKLEIVRSAFIKLTKTVTMSRYQLRLFSQTPHLKKDQTKRQRNLPGDLRNTNNTKSRPLLTNTKLILKAVNRSVNPETQSHRK